MVINQIKAARMLGVTRQTITNYEKTGLLRRIKRPGAWYTLESVRKLLGEDLHSAPKATEVSE